MTSGANDIITRAAKIAGRLFEDRMLVITPDDSRLHRFNETGTFIWQFLDKPRCYKEIAQALADHFDGIDQSEAMRHVTEFIDELIIKKLVTVAPSTRSP
jgi:hypothetical protein